MFPHDRFGLNRKIKETTVANFSYEGSSHDRLCTDPAPLEIFPEGRGGGGLYTGYSHGQSLDTNTVLFFFPLRDLLNKA